MNGNPPPPPPPGGDEIGLPPPMPTHGTGFECVAFGTFKQVLMMSIILFGFTGNLLSILSFWSERKKNGTSFLLTVLAFIDQSVVVCYLLLLVTKDWLKEQPVYSYYWIVAINPLLSALQMAASWMVIQVSLHRVIIVCFPTKKASYGSMKAVRYQVIITMVGSVLFTLPIWFEMQLVSIDGSVVGFQFRKELENNIYRYVYRSFLYYTAIFFVPVIILLYITPKLIMAIKESHRLNVQLNAKRTEKNNTTKSLIAIFIVFLVCHLLIPMRFFVGFIVPIDYHMCPYPYYFVFEFNEIWAVFNSSINFVFYVVWVTRFKRRLRYMLCPCELRRINPLSFVQTVTSSTSDGAVPNSRNPGHQVNPSSSP